MSEEMLGLRVIPQKGLDAYLISGGMLMTITGVFVDNTDDMNLNVKYQGYSIKFGGPSPAFYECSWFERNAKKEDVFPEESLKKVRTDNEQ